MAQAPFPIHAGLVAIAVDYSGINSRARGYIADRVAPRMPVDDPLFYYPSYPIEEAFTVYDNQIDRLGRLNEIMSSATEVTGSTLDYGLTEKVPYRDEMAMRNQAIPFTRKARAVRNVIDKNQLAREIRVAGMAMNLANYQTGYKTDLAAGTKWSDYANSDPVALVKTAKRGMLIPPNVAIMSEYVRDVLSMHPKISTYLGGSLQTGRMATDEELARAFGVDSIVVGKTIKQTSKRGQTLTTGNIWPDSFALHYQGPMGPDGLGLDANSPNFLSTFQWGSIVSGENPYRPGEMGLWGGVGVYTGESIVEKFVAPFAGYLFASVL